MTVRAMFVCDEKIQTRDGYKVKLTAVTGDSELAEKFFKWTPWGQIEMGIINDNAAEQFVPGCSYYLDFTAVEIGRRRSR